MSSKQVQLEATVRSSASLWREEQQHADRKSKESTFGLEVVEPLFSVLEWPRLKQGDLAGSGAYFEWPLGNGVDIALLDAGDPRAFIELKPTCGDGKIDLADTLTKGFRRRKLGYAVAAWFMDDAGLCVHQVQPGDVLNEVQRVSLSDPPTCARGLAILARSVVCQGLSPERWLATTVPNPNPIQPRYRARRLLAKAFEILGERLGPGCAFNLLTDYGGKTGCRSGFAFTELPGILLPGHGIGLDIRNTTNKLQCFTYSGGRHKNPRSVWVTLDDGCGDDVLAEFIDEKVLPEIAKLQHKANER